MVKSSRPRGKEEMAERRELALSYIRLQKSNASAERAIMEKWGVSHRTADADVKRAWRHLAEQGEAIDRPMRKHQLRSTFQSILLMAMQGKKLGPQAMQAAVALGRLDGLFTTDIHVSHSGTVNHVRNMTSDDKRQELASLLGMYLGEEEDEPGNGHDNGYNGGGNGAAKH